MRYALKFFKKYSSSFLNIHENKTSITGFQGYKTALAVPKNPFISVIYFEAQIENDEGAARIGFATRNCELRGPLGFDIYGYSYGSRNGYGFHNSKRIRFGERFNKHDIISAYFYKTQHGANIYFFINGKRVEKHFSKVLEGIYVPAVSLYNKCKVSCNFGPYFGYEDKIKTEIENLHKNNN